MKNKKTIFLVGIIVILLLGVTAVSAASNTTKVTKKAPVKDVVKKTNNNIQNKVLTKEKNNKVNKNVTKKVTKEDTNKETDKVTEKSNLTKKVDKTVKKETSTVDVNNYEELYNNLTDYNLPEGTDLTVNLIGDDYKLTEPYNTILLSYNICNLTINGNGKTIDGANQYQFLTYFGSRNVTIKNLTIANCNTSKNDYSNSYGGAILGYNYEMSNFELDNVKFINNQAFLRIPEDGYDYYDRYDIGGGALAILNANMKINNCKFDNNTAFFSYEVDEENFFIYVQKIEGGALYTQNSYVTINNTEFTSNSASGYYKNQSKELIGNGGAVHVTGSLLNVDNSTFKSNSVNGVGGAVVINNPAGSIPDYVFSSYEGESIGIQGDASIIMNSKFESNIANNPLNGELMGLKQSGSAGAIANWGNLTIDNCTFTANSAEIGGAINGQEGELRVTNSNFKNNGVGEVNSIMGGAISSSDVLIVSKSVFEGNQANSNNEPSIGGAIASTGYQLTIEDTEFKNNVANFRGGAVHYQGDSEYTDLKIDNCNFESNKVVGNDKTSDKKPSGGAIWTMIGVNTIKDSSFKSNEADYDGGAIFTDAIIIEEYVYDRDDEGRIKYDPETGDPIIKEIIKTQVDNSLNLQNSVFKSNKAGNKGGAVITACKDNNIEDSDFTSNDAKEGGAIYLPYDEQSEFNPTATVKNNIFYKNKPDTFIIDEHMIKLNETDNFVPDNGIVRFYVDESSTPNDSTLENDYVINYVVKDGTYLLEIILSQKEDDQTYRGTFITNTYYVQVDSNVTITVKAENAYVGDTTKITGELKYSILNKEYPFANKTVSIYVNDKFVGNVTTNSKGVYTLNYDATKVGTQSVLVKYEGNEFVNSAENKTTFTVKKMPTSITINVPSTVQKGNEVTIKGKLVDKDGKALNKEKVTIKLDGKVLTTVTTDNGEFTYKYTPSKSGELTFEVQFDETNKYLKSSNSSKVTVAEKTKTKTKTTVQSKVVKDCNTVKLVATVKDANNKAVNTGKVIFKLNGKTLIDSKANPLTATVKNGKATLKFKPTSDMYNSIAKLTAVYCDNDDYYKSTSKASTLKIIKRNAKITLTTKNLKAKSYDTIKLKAKVVDENKTLATTGVVTFKINKNTLKKNGKLIQVKVKNGYAKLSYKLNGIAAKTYSVTAVFSSRIHKRTETNTTLTVTKTKTHIKASNIKTNKNTATVKANILDNKNKNVKSTTKVTIKVNGKTVKHEVKVKNGKINLKIPTKLKKGTHKVTIIAGTNGKYTKSSKTIKLTVY